MNYMWHMPIALIGVALLLDVIAGDPAWLPHPVQLIGKAIEFGERHLRTGVPRQDIGRGTILVAGVVVIVAGCTWLVVGVAEVAGRYFAAAIAIFVAWTTLALCGLDAAARTVQRALERDDLVAARRALPALVGRDPASLDRNGVVRAVIESIAENSSDGVIAPLLYLFIGGPVTAMAYKGINTMDSMIGYTNARYLYFGRCAARLDDFANFVPARISAMCLAAAAAITGNRAWQALQVCRTDARRHPSPNAGFPEATVAGALGIQLGGPAEYDGEIEFRPTLGMVQRPVSVGDISAARKLMWVECLIGFVLMATCRLLLRTLWPK
jgi:adenosylcobinamide-phosphate synthase